MKIFKHYKYYSAINQVYIMMSTDDVTEDNDNNIIINEDIVKESFTQIEN